jgi:hypothetical protein
MQGVRNAASQGVRNIVEWVNEQGEHCKCMIANFVNLAKFVNMWLINLYFCMLMFAKFTHALDGYIYAYLLCLFLLSWYEYVWWVYACLLCLCMRADLYVELMHVFFFSVYKGANKN